MNSPQFPDTLGEKHDHFRRVAEDDPLCAFLREPFARVPGKTDAFATYAGYDFRGSLQIILHSPETLRTDGEQENRRYLARKSAPWSHSEILTPTALKSLASAEQLPEDMHETLWYDGVVEGDSLHFFNALAESKSDIPQAIWPILILWLRDEINHRDGFQSIYNSIYGSNPEREQADAAQTRNFAPFAKIMNDPFALLVSLMYDEVATVIGYRNDLPAYRSVGLPVEQYVRRVNADEGWHFQKFLNLAALHYPDRASDIDYVLDSLVTEADATAYTGTFIFDRGDSSGAKRFNEKDRQQTKSMVKRHLLERIKTLHH